MNVSSVLELGRHAVRILVGEVNRRQTEYAEGGIFTSDDSFAYWERKGKRAKRKGPSQFNYATKEEDGVYKIHHFDGVV